MNLNNIEIWYHAALMPGWLSIVAEQMAVASHVGLTNIQCGAIGSDRDIEDMVSLAGRYGVSLRVVVRSERHNAFEYLTLDALWRSAANSKYVLYWHTKGASDPISQVRREWRRVMQRHTIAPWREHLSALAEYDTVGANLQTKNQAFGHNYNGNFWLARSDYIASLPCPVDFRDRRYANSLKRWRRYHAEGWLFENPNGRHCSLLYSNVRWSKNHTARNKANSDIEGFSYLPFGA